MALRTLWVAIGMKFSRYHFALGLAMLIWSLVGYLYLGNMVLYDSFSSILIIDALAIGLALISRRVQPSPGPLIVSGLLIGIDFLIDPLSVYPAIILVLFISLASFFEQISIYPFRQALLKAGRTAGMIGLSAAVCRGQSHL